MSPEGRRTILFVVFIAITIVTAVLVLLANIGAFGEDVRNGEFAKWGIGGVLAEIVGVTVLVFKRTFVNPIRPRVSLTFPIPLNEIDLDPEACSFQLITQEKTITGKVIPVVGLGGWSCVIPTEVSSVDDLITLELKETNGRRWRIRSFYPYFTTQEAREIV